MADYVIEHTHVVDHERFLEAGVYGRDLWEWGMKYAGRHETDGAIPMAAVLASAWGYGGKANIKAAAKLVEVGLWERTGRGYQVLKWSEMGNKTKAELEVKREAWRKKKQRSRESVPAAPPAPCPPLCPQGTPHGTLERVLNSPSISSSDLVVSDLDPPVRSPTPPPVETAPPWFGEALATVELQTCEKLRPPDCWLRYSGHRGNVGKPINQRDAVYWLTTVMVPEARRERERSRVTALRPLANVPAPAPYHALFRPPTVHERPASRELAREAARRLAGAFG